MNEVNLPDTVTTYASQPAWPEFQQSLWLWLLPLVLVLVVLLFLVAHKGREKALATFAAQRLLGNLLNSLSNTRRNFKAALLLLGVGALVLALARPQYGYRWSETHSRGIDVMFVLDASRSMLATDIPPNRLQRAKLAVLDFVEQLDGDRVGLVAFAGDAFVQCPLTLDYHAFNQSLEAVDTGTIPVGGTDFSKAIDIAQAAFAKDNNHKILILITDGEDLEGSGLKRAREAAADGVTIYTVGVGTAEGSLIPVSDAYNRQQFLTDAQGQRVTTRLEAQTLMDIAEVTGGFYVPLGSAGQGLQSVYHNGLQAIPQQELASRMQRQGIERFQWPLGLALLLLTWEPLISNRRTPRLRALRLLRRNGSNSGANNANGTPTASALALLLTLGTCAFYAPQAQGQTQAQTQLQTQQPVRAFDTSHAAATPPPAVHAAETPAAQAATPEPIATALTPTASSTASPATTPAVTPAAAISQRRAESLYRRGDYATAQAAFEALLQADPANAKIRYNLGNTLFARRDLPGALKAYNEVLQSGDIPLQADAFYNLGSVRYAQGEEALATSDPAATMEHSTQAINSAPQAIRNAQAVLAEAERLQQAATARAADTGAPRPPQAQPQGLPQQPEEEGVPQQIVQQAIQQAEQAKEAATTALEGNSEFIRQAQSASQLWQRAEADFRSSHELAPSQTTADDARHNSQQARKSIDALRAGISQRERANNTHEQDARTLEALIEELKKLLKESPQSDNQDNQNQQDQQDQNQQNPENQQNQSQSSDSQSDSQQNQQQEQQQNQKQDQSQQQQQQNQQDTQGGENQQPQNSEPKEDNTSASDNEQQPQQSDAPDQQNPSENPQQDRQQDGQQSDRQPQDAAPQPEQQPQGGDDSRQQPQQQGQQEPQQQQQGDSAEPAAPAPEQQQPEQQQGQGGESPEPVALSDEQAGQLAEQAERDAGAPRAGQEAPRPGVMSQQEAASLLESLRNSGKVLPLSGQGHQRTTTRPLQDW